MAKILIFVAIIAIIYALFFRKKSVESRAESSNENALEMVECASCKTFVSKDEAIKKGAQYFCNTKCLDKNR